MNFHPEPLVHPMEADDLSLVKKARAGEPEAFRALVVRYQRKVYALALGIVKDPDLAWDVAQEAFLRVHEHLPEFEGKSSFSTWLFRIATHLSIDSIRRERTSLKEDVDEVNEAHLADGAEGILGTGLGNDPRENLLRRELASKLQAALATLPEKHRTILVLREVEGLSYEELAERLDIHKGTVMSRLFHARRKMQAALRGYAGALARAAEARAAADDPGDARGGTNSARPERSEAAGRADSAHPERSEAAGRAKSRDGEEG